MRKLFSGKLNPGLVHFSLLLLRVSTGLLILMHGIPKLEHFNEMSLVFGDPLHIGSELSLILVIFAEVGCAVFLIVGLFTRLMILPLLIEMVVILLKIHNHSPFHMQELDWHYLIACIIILVCGPGKVSVDGMIGRG